MFAPLLWTKHREGGIRYLAKRYFGSIVPIFIITFSLAPSIASAAAKLLVESQRAGLAITSTKSIRLTSKHGKSTANFRQFVHNIVLSVSGSPYNYHAQAA